ncbi:MAG TPA: hypothetical protein VJB15_02590 [Rhodothermia bacterium]|nr:hypothetical protein [Rhodothermia bacterium]
MDESKTYSRAQSRNSVTAGFRRGVLLAFASFLNIPIASAQQSTSEGDSFRSEIFVGSRPENYLRYLQTMGLVRLYPWSSRGFSPRELDGLIPRDTAHPWSGRFSDSGKSVQGIRYDFVRPVTTFRYNTGFAYGTNDGPVWAGRGLTSAIQLGIVARWKPVSLALAPTAFRAENRPFFTQPTGFTGNAAFSNALFGSSVDFPQRFGDSPYSQLDPGQSTLRIDLPILAVGASTANIGWGPGTEYPLLLGNNAAGFPHLFVGSSAPIDIFIARLHGAVMWGRLAQSKFSSVTGPIDYTSRAEPGRRRFASGFVVVAQPRGITGLEVGGARFLHSIWPRSGIPRSYLTKVFQGFLKKNLRPDTPDDPRFPEDAVTRGIADNQLAEIFMRWVLPKSGFEMSAEYGREDHSEDVRDLEQEPDHARFYNFGVRKVFSLGRASMTAARFELINFQLPSLSRYRGEGEIYVHGLIRQGHTQRGQLLGAAVGVGAAAGSTLAVDHYTPSGRWTVSWVRDLRQEADNFLILGVQRPFAMDVTHALGVEMTRMVRGFDVTTGLTFVRSFNREFASDAANINAVFGARYNIN